MQLLILLCLYAFYLRRSMEDDDDENTDMEQWPASSRGRTLSQQAGGKDTLLTRVEVQV